MEADFSGYATKAGLKCSDGRTIMPDAFKHQDTMTVPLVWQHGHSDPENVLGHALLENRDDGVYCYGFFNESQKAVHTRGLIAHKDVTMLSIWANDLIERSGRVLHGAIREVSLVLSGANPGALIENVTIRHSDMDDTVLDDEAIIFTGLSFEHTGVPIHEDKKEKVVTHASTDSGGDGSGDGSSSDLTIQDVYDSMSAEQKDVLHYMIGEALSSAAAEHSNMDEDDDEDSTDTKKGNEMKHNVFEGSDTGTGEKNPVISHDDMKGIIANASRGGSLKDAIEDYALSHGITDIDELFPAESLTSNPPPFLTRRVEWVASLLSAVSKSPFSRLKTVNADLTMDEARAKGYVTGTMKAEEFFTVSKRVTTPTTIYKKQALDRDDVVDITDFDVVVWLKSEMRLMLDEELARAILLGDGRDISSPDKINEQNIRPIAKEGDVFATQITSASDPSSLVDAIITNRKEYKGSGMPTMFTSETVISSFMLLKDTLGRRIYASLDEVASELRVAGIVPVEAMDESTVLAILVNPSDYVVGATAGGQVSMFDDFDIDYNKQKYLIETRCSGALTKMKSAIIVSDSGVAGNGAGTSSARGSGSSPEKAEADK